MKRKGFGLVDAIVGMFILGLIAVLALPLFSSSFTQYSRINTQTEMIYLGETIYERLQSKDDYSSTLIEELIDKDELIFDDLSDDYLDIYEARVVRLDQCDNFVDINIIINSKSSGGNISDVQFQGSILK